MDSFSGNFGDHAQFFQAQGAVIHAIEADFLMLFAGETEHFDSEKFDGAEQLGAAFQEQGGVRSGKFNQDFGTLPIALLPERWVDGNAVFQVQTRLGDNTAQKLIDLVGGRDFVGNRHGK